MAVNSPSAHQMSPPVRNENGVEHHLNGYVFRLGHLSSKIFTNTGTSLVSTELVRYQFDKDAENFRCLSEKCKTTCPPVCLQQLPNYLMDFD
jgi:hypothetical protein